MELSRLTYSVIVLGKLTTDISLGLDIATVQQTANLGTYCDSVIRTLGDLTTTKTDHDIKDMYWHFKYVFGRVKAQYEERIERITRYNLDPGGQPSLKDLSPLQLLDSLEVDATNNNEAESSYMPLDLQDFVWEDMLADWPTSLDGSSIS